MHDYVQVLWPECGWRPVSLTDMMTSISVKKVYQKATLCVHPDKVQQKGANIQQKYIAEKVFDVLKVWYLKLNIDICIADLLVMLAKVIFSALSVQFLNSVDNKIM